MKSFVSGWREVLALDGDVWGRGVGLGWRSKRTMAKGGERGGGGGGWVLLSPQLAV